MSPVNAFVPRLATSRAIDSMRSSRLAMSVSSSAFDAHQPATKTTPQTIVRCDRSSCPTNRFRDMGEITGEGVSLGRQTEARNRKRTPQCRR